MYTNINDAVINFNSCPEMYTRLIKNITTVHPTAK